VYGVCATPYADCGRGRIPSAVARTYSFIIFLPTILQQILFFVNTNLENCKKYFCLCKSGDNLADISDERRKILDGRAGKKHPSRGTSVVLQRYNGFSARHPLLRKRARMHVFYA